MTAEDAMMQVDHENDDDHLKLNNQATTIDASVLQSRIRQSESIQREDQTMSTDEQPHFPALSAVQASGKVEYRRVRCPPHRYTPLREHWEQILTPLVEYLKLQVRVGRHPHWFDEGKGRRCFPTYQCQRVVPGHKTHFLPGSLVGIRRYGTVFVP